MWRRIIICFFSLLQRTVFEWQYIRYLSSCSFEFHTYPSLLFSVIGHSPSIPTDKIHLSLYRNYAYSRTSVGCSKMYNLSTIHFWDKIDSIFVISVKFRVYIQSPKYFHVFNLERYSCNKVGKFSKKNLPYMWGYHITVTVDTSFDTFSC